jgi:hypothetical protein
MGSASAGIPSSEGLTIDTSSTKRVVWAFHVVTAHILGLCADGVIRHALLRRRSTQIDLISASIGHVVGKFHVAVDGIVDGLDAVPRRIMSHCNITRERRCLRVVHGEFRIVRCWMVLVHTDHAGSPTYLGFSHQ